jgi:hypothetical protein
MCRQSRVTTNWRITKERNRVEFFGHVISPKTKEGEEVRCLELAVLWAMSNVRYGNVPYKCDCYLNTTDATPNVFKEGDYARR